MIIIYGTPKLFWILKLFFPAADPKHTVIAFGDRIYAPGTLPEHILVHERVHLNQQRHSRFFAVFWCSLYILFARFRYKAELAAYQAQWEYIKQHEEFHERQRLLRFMSEDLSGPLYNNLVSYHTAIHAITKH